MHWRTKKFSAELFAYYPNGILDKNEEIAMPYLIYALDHEDMDVTREMIRDNHRNHLRSVGNKLLASGALLTEDGKTIIGGISLLDTDNYDEAKKFAFDDPYQKAGIRKEIKILKWRKRWWEGELIIE